MPTIDINVITIVAGGALCVGSAVILGLILAALGRGGGGPEHVGWEGHSDELDRMVEMERAEAHTIAGWPVTETAEADTGEPDPVAAKRRSPMRNPLTYLSLFSGIGGIDLGLERAGMTVVGQVELDPFCRRVLSRHWPEVPRHDDVRTAVDWWRSEPRPAVDLVAGGFPCQPVSLAGRQRGQDDERWLWPAFGEVVRRLRPRWVLLENVPGLLGRGMGDVLGDLAACGYDAEWDCVPTAAVGAPHLRDRVFVVAYPDGAAQYPVGDALTSNCAAPVVRGGAPEPGGRGSALADAQGERRGTGRQGRPARVGANRPRLQAEELANADRLGRSRQARLGNTGRWPEPQHCGWWSAEPDVGRVADGVPARVDRLRALGNAVVPQVAEHIGRLILGAAQGVTRG